MKLPKRRRRVVAVEAPRRIRRTGPGHGSISGGARGNNGDGKHYMEHSTTLTCTNNIKVYYCGTEQVVNL